MIYIIRHGQTEQNKDGILLGRTDAPLNDQGRREAGKAGQEVKLKTRFGISVVGYQKEETEDIEPVHYRGYQLSETGQLIMSPASSKQMDILILGAFGCGAFNNPPHIVAGPVCSDNFD